MQLIRLLSECLLHLIQDGGGGDDLRKAVESISFIGVLVELFAAKKATSLREASPHASLINYGGSWCSLKCSRKWRFLMIVLTPPSEVRRVRRT